MKVVRIEMQVGRVVRVLILSSFLAVVHAASGQTPTNIQVTSVVQQSSPARLGVNLGDQDYWDSGQLMKNLVWRNPGFEAQKFRSILKCAAVTANTCTDDNNYSGQPTGFWQGGTYLILSGAHAGLTGTVVQSTKNPNSCGGCGQIVQFDQNINAAVGDYFVVSNSMPGAGDTGWWDSTSGGGTITSETNDISPNSPGKQALVLNASASGQSSGVASYFDTYSGISFIQMNGNFEVTFRAKGVGGNNQLNISSQRFGGSVFLNKTLTLTNAWQDYTLTFTAAETGTSIGDVVLSFTAAGGSVELDDVSLDQTNSDPNNPTAYRDDVVNTLKELNPGVIRMMAAGAALGSDLINQIQPPFARYRMGFNSGQTVSSDVAYGIHEFLQLCQTVNADPWITIPTATTQTEMTAFMQYLTGDGSDQYSALRIARGQSAPWTTVFNKIHIELGNETWNGSFKGESMAYPAYPQLANQTFGLVKSSPGYVASKFDLVIDGWASDPGYNTGILATSTKHDSIDIAPYLLYSMVDEPATNQFGALLAEPELWDTAAGGGEVYANMKIAAAAPTPTNVNVYETNLGPMIGTVTQAEINALTPSVAAGLAHTEHMLLMMKLGVKYQNTFALPQYKYSDTSATNRPLVPMWGIVIDMGTTNRRRPQFLTQALANSVINGNMVQTVHTGADPTWNQKSLSDSVTLPTAHDLQSFAFVNGATSSVVVFNLSQTLTLPVTFSGANAPSGSVTVSQITSANITDNNETSNVVQTATQTLSAFNPATAYSLPPFSMTVFTSNGTATQPPAFSVAGGTYTSAQTVSLTDGTSGATIYYTTDGSTPSTSSTQYTGPITVSASETINAMATSSGLTPSAVTSAAYVISAQTATATPVFSVSGGTYTTTQTVSISDATSGASIYYTTNGSVPTTSSTLYAGPITVSSTETLNAIATATNYTTSGVATATYTITPTTAATPVFSVPAGSYTTTQTVSIADATAGATIYYTTNGAAPTTSSPVYAGPITVSATETLSAIAAATNYTTSSVATAAYTITPAKAATPVFTVASGNYSATQTVGITDATASAVIYYTTDGSVPTTSSAVYAGPITVSATETLNAIAAATNYTTSAVATAVYTITPVTPAVAPPVLSLPSGTYTTAQQVAIASTTPGATIFYTTDGTTPTTTSPTYQSAIMVDATATVKALATKAQYVPSPVVSASYTIASTTPQTAPPTFSAKPGTYSSAQSVVLSDSTPGAVIYYTVKTASKYTSVLKYSKPIELTQNATIHTYAIAPSYTKSAEIINSYVISSGTVEPPTSAPILSLAPGTYSTKQTVTLTDATPGSLIYYTIDGTTPTTASTLYSGPITVSASLIVKAIAEAPGCTVSTEADGVYVIGSGVVPVVFTPGMMTLRGTSELVGTTLQLTNGGPSEIAAAWSAKRVAVDNFNIVFTFNLPSSKADGFTFTLQNSGKGNWASGGNGGALGYQGISNSVAIKFGLYNGATQQEVSQTGLLTNGAAPSTVAVDMSGSNINLHSGSVYSVNLVYNGTTLTETVTDTQTKATFTHSYKVNIASVLGSTTAYAGFTASTGGFTSVQDILSYGYSGN